MSKELNKYNNTVSLLSLEYFDFEAQVNKYKKLRREYCVKNNVWELHFRTHDSMGDQESSGMPVLCNRRNIDRSNWCPYCKAIDGLNKQILKYSYLQRGIKRRLKNILGVK
jgi:hypothetical protein